MATGFNTQVDNGEYRLQFETDNKEYYLLMQEAARRCVDGKPVSNSDRIRAMSDEELSDFLAYTWATSARAWQKDTGETLHWLKQRVEGE